MDIDEKTAWQIVRLLVCDRRELPGRVAVRRQ